MQMKNIFLNPKISMQCEPIILLQLAIVKILSFQHHFHHICHLHIGVCKPVLKICQVKSRNYANVIFYYC